MQILNKNMLSTTSLGVERSGSNSVEVVVPRPRESHTVNMLGSFLYLFGGWSWPNAMNDLFRLNVSKILRKIKSSTNDGNSKTTQELKNKTFNTVVRKVPSVGSIMMTELEGTNSLMVTGSSSGNGSNTSSVEMPMFKVSNKAFRSSKERRDGSDMKHRRSNSNLLVARQTSSPLPNIRQLAIDSGDDDSDDGSDSEVEQAIAAAVEAQAKQTQAAAEATERPPAQKKRKMTKGVQDTQNYESKKDNFYDDL